MEKLLALQAKLASGEITQEQFASEVALLLSTNELTQEQHDEALKGGDDENKPLTRKDIEALLEKERQSAADKVRTEYSQKLKDAEKARDLLELEKMTETQRAEHEKAQYEKTLKEREAALNAREIEIEVGDQLAALELPLSFKPFFIKAESKDVAKANIEALSNVWRTELKNAVEERFKSLGDNRGAKGGGNPPTKKWTDLTLTEQGQLLVKDPAQAKQLASASGITLNI